MRRIEQHLITVSITSIIWTLASAVHLERTRDQMRREAVAYADQRWLESLPKRDPNEQLVIVSREIPVRDGVTLSIDETVLKNWRSLAFIHSGNSTTFLVVEAQYPGVGGGK